MFKWKTISPGWLQANCQITLCLFISLFKLHIICCFQGLWHETKRILGLEQPSKWQVQIRQERYRGQHLWTDGPVSMNFSWGESRHPSAVKIVMVPHLNKVWFWKTLDTSKLWHHVKISHSEVDSDHPPLIYDSPVPINPYKINNLNKMVKKYIPEPQRSFYQTLVPDEKNM